MRFHLRSHLIIVIGFVTLMLVVFGLYYPGLSGPFVFDDIPNLQSLGGGGGVKDWPSALYFIFSGGAGPLGRPLTLLSFLINDQTWPTDPFGFKYTNLMLHLFNGVLVFVLGRQLGARFMLGNERRVDLFALLATAIWLIHPIQISAALFVVQRMTSLSSLFMLLALISFLHYRVRSYSTANVVSCAVLVAVCITLGAFSKENAVMTVFYIAVIDGLLFQKREGLWRPFYWLVITGCVIVALAIFKMAINADVSWLRRDFTLGQRLLTESRVLWRYIGEILLPRPSDFSLFNDDYIVSINLFKPISTLYALIAWLGLLVAAICLRKKIPLLLFAVCWYVAGHLMESTVLPLELYYEHRNYLPMLGICWLLTFVLMQLPVGEGAKAVVVSAILFLFGFVLFANVKVWKSEDMMAEVWSIDHPDSPRAQQMAIRKAISLGDGQKAKQLIDQILMQHSDNAHLALQKLMISCFLKEKIDSAHYRELLKSAPHKIGVTEALVQIEGLILGNKCPDLSLSDVDGFYAAILANNFYNDALSRAVQYQQLADLAVEKRDLNLAIEYLDKAYQADPSNIQLPLTAAYWLADAGLFDDAAQYLTIARSTRPTRYFQKYQYRELLLIVEEQIEAIKKKRTKDQ